MVYPYVVNHNGKEYQIGEDVPDGVSSPISVTKEAIVEVEETPQIETKVEKPIKKSLRGGKKS